MPDDDMIVEVDIQAGTPPPVVEKTVELENKPEPVDDLKKQFDELSARSAADTEAARRATEEARQARDQLARTTAEHETRLSESNLSVLDNAIHAAQTEADSFQREQQAAFEAGEFARAAEIGRKMAKAEARVVRLEEGKADLELRKSEAAKKPVETERPAPVVSSDPFEAAISNLTPRTQRWFREQKKSGHDFITDTALNAEAASAHWAAVAKGHVIDSDSYFDFCEQRLGLKETPKSNGEVKETTRTRAMPSAPVSRDSSPSGGMTATQVKLTPGEQRAATDGTVVWNTSDSKTGAVKGQPVGLKEYARRKSEMQKEGRYGVLSDS